MNLEFKTELTRHLGESLVEIGRLTHMMAFQDDRERAVYQQRLDAHLEREKCIEKLLEIEHVLDELGRGK